VVHETSIGEKGSLAEKKPAEEPKSLAEKQPVQEQKSLAEKKPVQEQKSLAEKKPVEEQKTSAGKAQLRFNIGDLVAYKMTDAYDRWVVGQITQTNFKGENGVFNAYRVSTEQGCVLVERDDHDVKKINNPGEIKEIVNTNLILMPWEGIMGVVGLPDPFWSDEAVDLIARKLFPKPGDLPPMWKDANSAEKSIIISMAGPIGKILEQYGIEPGLGLGGELGITGGSGKDKKKRKKKK